MTDKLKRMSSKLEQLPLKDLGQVSGGNSAVPVPENELGQVTWETTVDDPVTCPSCGQKALVSDFGYITRTVSGSRVVHAVFKDKCKNCGYHSSILEVR